MGLILGKSFTSLQGIHPIPGVIDSGYTGEIKIMLQPPTKAVQTHAGRGLLKWRCRCVRGQSEHQRGKLWVRQSSVLGARSKEKQVFKEIIIHEQVIKGVLDTGADVSCIAGKDWQTANWPHYVFSLHA